MEGLEVIFKRKPKMELIDRSKQLDARTHMLIEAVKAMPAHEATRVISAILRDRRDITAEDMRKIAYELDRDADRRDRAGVHRNE